MLAPMRPVPTMPIFGSVLILFSGLFASENPYLYGVGPPWTAASNERNTTALLSVGDAGGIPKRDASRPVLSQRDRDEVTVGGHLVVAVPTRLRDADRLRARRPARKDDGVRFDVELAQRQEPRSGTATAETGGTDPLPPAHATNAARIRIAPAHFLPMIITFTTAANTGP